MNDSDAFASEVLTSLRREYRKHNNHLQIYLSGVKSLNELIGANNADYSSKIGALESFLSDVLLISAADLDSIEKSKFHSARAISRIINGKDFNSSTIKILIHTGLIHAVSLKASGEMRLSQKPSF